MLISWAIDTAYFANMLLHRCLLHTCHGPSQVGMVRERNTLLVAALAISNAPYSPSPFTQPPLSPCSLVPATSHRQHENEMFAKVNNRRWYRWFPVSVPTQIRPITPVGWQFKSSVVQRAAGHTRSGKRINICKGGAGATGAVTKNS